MTLCDRLIGGAVNLVAKGFDLAAPFWQTPREVEWAKAAADGLAEREAEEEVAEPSQFDWVRATAVNVGIDPDMVERDLRSRLETSATTPVADSGPAESVPPAPSAGVGPNSPKWIRDLIEATEDYVGAPRGSLSSPLKSVEHAAAVVDVEAGGVFWYAEDDPARSAAVDPPASVPAAESPTPEFDWVTTAIPVIAGVLAEHTPRTYPGTYPATDHRVVYCGHADVSAEFADWQDWRDHVSPIVAASLQTVCPSMISNEAALAINALRIATFSGDRPRPLTDFPKHQK